MRTRLLSLLVLILLFGAGSCKKDKPPEPVKVIPAEHFFGTLRLSVDNDDADKEVYFYVETTYEGSNGLLTEISLDEGEYRVTAATPIDTDEAAFYIVTKHVQITSGKTKEVRFDLPEPPAPSLEDPEEGTGEPEYVSGGCGSSSGSAFVEKSKTIRASVGSSLSKAQNDPLYMHLSAIYYSLQSQPPAVGRMTVENVPVIDREKNDLPEEINLEMVAAQIRHLTSWLESRKYNFVNMNRNTEVAASHLATIIQEAESCQDQELWKAATVEKSYEDNLLEQVKAFRQQFETVTSSIANKIEEAGRSTGNR